MNVILLILLSHFYLGKAQLDTSMLNSDEIWLHNFEEAKTLAAKYDKKILMYFSGSDWCKPCILLKKEILETEAFLTFAKENLILLEVDFPQKKKNRLSKEQMESNEALAERYNLQGAFPLIVVTDHNGRVLGNSGYQKNTVSEYIDQIQSMLSL